MSRQPVTMRQATHADVPFLVELWGEVLRKADRQEQVHDLELIVKEAAESPSDGSWSPSTPASQPAPYSSGSPR